MQLLRTFIINKRLYQKVSSSKRTSEDCPTPEEILIQTFDTAFIALVNQRRFIQAIHLIQAHSR